MAHGVPDVGESGVKRANQIGRRQASVLMVLMAMSPRPVDQRLLAYAANDGGDQTQGRRVLAALETRGLITRQRSAQGRSWKETSRYVATEAGRVAWVEWLPSFVDRLTAEGGE